jgi:uncharacterized protein
MDIVVPLEPLDPLASSRQRRPVAPAWHTALLVELFMGLTAAGVVFQRRASGGAPDAAVTTSVIPLYLSLIVAEWGLVLYVVRMGLSRTGTTVRELIGGRWGSIGDVVRDVALGVGAWALWKLIGVAWELACGPEHAASIASYLPHGVLESTLWIGLSVSAGFCEELVFRGYFQRQFAAWFGGPWIALLLQGVLFGVSHGYQGVGACARIALYGVGFGLLALWRRSLRPGMLAHALTDVLAGIFRV